MYKCKPSSFGWMYKQIEWWHQLDAPSQYFDNFYLQPTCQVYVADLVMMDNRRTIQW